MPSTLQNTQRYQRLQLLGLPLDVITLSQTLQLLSNWIQEATPRTIITLNPEITVHSQQDLALKTAIQAADLITADGIGIVWATKKLKHQQIERAPGYDIACGLMQRHQKNLRVYFLGSKPGVAEQAAQQAQQTYGVQIAGTQHGYFTQDQEPIIAQKIRTSNAHIVLAGMGSGRQELFNQKYKQHMSTPILLGCGGVLDVLAGTAQLAPHWTRRAGIEFIWRVGLDHKRWKRIPNLIQFIQLVKKNPT